MVSDAAEIVGMGCAVCRNLVERKTDFKMEPIADDSRDKEKGRRERDGEREKERGVNFVRRN